MRRAFLIGGLMAAGVAGVAALSPASAQTQVPNTFKAGNWAGGPYFENQRFSYCYLNVGYTDGTQLMLQLNAQMQMFVGASKSNWNMNPAQQFDVSFELPGYKKTFRGRVTEQRRNTIWFEIGNDPALRQALAGGGTMIWVDAQQTRFNFNIQGGDNALRKLMACAALYGAD